MADFLYHPSQSLNPYYPSPPQSYTLSSAYNTFHQPPFHYSHLLPPAAGPSNSMTCLFSSQPFSYHPHHHLQLQQQQYQHPPSIPQLVNKVTHQVFDKRPMNKLFHQEDNQDMDNPTTALGSTLGGSGDADQEKEVAKESEEDSNKMDVDETDVKHSESVIVPEESIHLSEGVMNEVTPGSVSELTSAAEIRHEEEMTNVNQNEDNGEDMEIDYAAGEHGEMDVKVGAALNNACNESAAAVRNDSNAVKEMEIDEMKDSADMAIDFTQTVKCTDSADPNNLTKDTATGNIQHLKTETGNVSLKKDKKATYMGEEVSTLDGNVRVESLAAATERPTEGSDVIMRSDEIPKVRDHQYVPEKHLRLQEELKALKRERFLWQLYNIGNDIEKATDDVDAEKSNIKDVMKELDKFQHEAGKRKIEQAKYLKEIAHREKKIAERCSKLGRIQPKRLRFKEEITCISSKFWSEESNSQLEATNLLQKLLSIEQNPPISDVVHNENSTVSARTYQGGLHLCIELLITSKDHIMGFEKCSSIPECAQESWFSMVKNFFVPLIQVFTSARRSNDDSVADLYLGVKGLLTTATFCGGSSPVSSSEYEDMLRTFTSVITAKSGKTVAWEMSLRALAYISSFIDQYHESDKAMSYMGIDVDNLVSVARSRHCGLPYPILLEATSEVFSTGPKYVEKMIQGLEEAFCSSFSDLRVHGNFKSIEDCYQLLECLTNKLFPRVAEIDGLEKLLVHFAIYLWNATWTLSNFYRDEVLTDACWILSYLSYNSNDKIQAALGSGVVPRLIELLGHSSSSVVIPALRTIGNIVIGDDLQTHMVIDHQALPPILKLLTNIYKKSIKKEACWMISNITAGNTHQIQVVIEAGIIESLVWVLKNAEFEVKKEAAWGISNATSAGTHNQIKFMVSKGYIDQICDLLTCSDPKVITVCLEELENIFLHGRAEKDLGRTGDENIYVQMIEDAEGFDKISNLQTHDNNDIYLKSVKILETFWSEDDIDAEGSKMEEVD